MDRERLEALIERSEWPMLLLACVAVGLYLSRMFFVTAFYHRYFSHRAFSAGRVTQFVMAILGATAGQRGPLWWAAHHREHHLNADSADEPHSPAHCAHLQNASVPRGE